MTIEQFEKLKRAYSDREFANYQEVVKKCNAVELAQCLCYGHSFLNKGCTIEKCYAASMENLAISLERMERFIKCV